MLIGGGAGGYVGAASCPRVEGDEDNGGRVEGDEESGGRDGRLGPPADPAKGECLRLDETPECREGEPPEESVADLKGWIVLMEGRLMGRGPGDGDVAAASGSACRPDLGLALLAGESEPGGTAGMPPPSSETGRDALPTEPAWRDPEPLVARDSGAVAARKGEEEWAPVLAGSTKRSARLGPGGERGRLARMGEPLREVCWRAVSVGVNDSSSWERKREDRRDSRVSIWKSGESK